MDSNLKAWEPTPLQVGAAAVVRRERRKLAPCPKFVPEYDRILVEVEDVSEVAVIGGTIITPDAYKAKSTFGTILDAGLGARDTMRSHGILLGDRIMFARYAGVLGPNGGVTSQDRVVFPWDEKEVAFLMVGDILANFDKYERLHVKKTQEVRVGTDGKHFVVDVT